MKMKKLLNEIESKKKKHKRFIKKYWGPRCKDHCTFCAGCTAWELFDRYWSIFEESREYKDF